MTFDELLAKHLDSLDSYVAAVEAERFRDWMVKHHPDVLDHWRKEREVVEIARAITQRDRSERAKARLRAGARRFAEAAEQAERTGDYAGLAAFAVLYPVDDANTRKRVGDMTGADHRYVAKGYRMTAKRTQMLAAFHSAVAKRVGDRRTADVFTEVEYEEMYASIVGEAA